MNALQAIFTKIGLIIGSVFLAGASLMGVVPQQQVNTKTLGANGVVPTIAAFFETSLSTAITSGATSMTLVTATTSVGTALPSGYYSFVIDQGTPYQEVTEGTLSGTSVTGMVRGIDPQNPTATSSALMYSHNSGADIKITIYSWAGHVSRILTGSDTFPGIVYYPSSVTQGQLQTNTSSLANVDYVNNVASSGAPAATNGTPGLVQIATSVQILAGLDGSPTRYVVPSSFFGSTPSSTASAQVPVAVLGKLSANFLSGISPSFTNLTASGTVKLLTVTSTLLATNASGTVISGTSGTASTGSILAFNNGAWQAGMVSTIGTSSLAVTSTSTINVATYTLPSAGANNWYQFVLRYTNGSGGNAATTTFAIGGSTILQCDMGNGGTGGTIDLSGTITMFGSTSLEEIAIGHSSMGNTGSCTSAAGATPSLFTVSMASSPLLTITQKNGTAASFTATSTLNLVMYQ